MTDEIKHEPMVINMDDRLDEHLRSVAALASLQLELEEAIKAQEDVLKGLKNSYKQVSQVDIPEALAEAGVSSFKLKDGMKVDVQPFYSASIPKDRYDEAMDWLRNQGHGDLIKNTISVDFGKGEDDAANAMKEILNHDGQSFTDKTGVHPQTLKAFVREQTELGQNLPLDLLGVFIGQKTTIKEA